MPPSERKRPNIMLVLSAVILLASAVNLWRSMRIVAITFLVLLAIPWILNLTAFSANRPLPRDKVPKHPLGLGS